MSIWTILKEGLEASLGPIVWISGLGSTGAPDVSIEVGAVILNIFHVF
jgi:hypothetical protein